MILARSGELPLPALAAFLSLAVIVGTMLAMDHFHRAWTLYGPPKRIQRTDVTEAPPPAEVLPPGPITPYTPPPPEPEAEPETKGKAKRPAPGTAAAVALAHETDGNGHGASAMILPMRRSHHGPGFSQRYVAYLRGQVPGDDGKTFWPDRIKPWKAAHRAAGGQCEIGRVLARGGQPNCGSAVPLVHMDTDHITYDNLFHETRADVAFGCHTDHMRRETLKQAGLDIYEQWGRP